MCKKYDHVKGYLEGKVLAAVLADMILAADMSCFLDQLKEGKRNILPLDD